MKRVLSVFISFSIIFSTFCFSTNALAGGGIDYSRATQINENSNINGNFGFLEFSQKVYKITPKASNYYRFTLTNESVEMRTGIYGDNLFSGAFNMFFGYIEVNIYNSREKRLSYTSVKCGYVGNITLNLQKGETYYIVLNAVSSGNYNFKVKSFNDIGGNTWSEAIETDSTGSLVSAIDVNGDADWLTFQTDKYNSFYYFSLENISVNTGLYLYLYEYVEGAGDFPFREIDYLYANTSYSDSFSLKLKTNTKYYYKIYSSGNGGYLLETTQIWDAVGDSMADAFKIDVNNKYTTSLDAGSDIDYLAFNTGSEEAYYHIDLNDLSVNDNQYYLSFRIELYDKYGTLVTSGGTSVNNTCNINAKLSPNSTYYIKLYDNDCKKGNYEIKVHYKADKFGDTINTAGSIALNKKVKSSIDGYKDVDWIKFVTTSSKNDYYKIDLNDLSVNDDRYYLTFQIELYDEHGTEINSNHTSCYNNCYIYEKLSPNTAYYLKLYDSESKQGNYEITVSTITDNESNSLSGAKSIKINKQYTCNLAAPSDIDWFKISVPKDGCYYLSIVNESNTSSVHITLYNKYERQMHEIYTGRMYGNDVMLDKGDYYIKVDGEEVGYYTFVLSQCGNGHTYNSGKVISPATCTSYGTKKYTCKYCGKTKTEDIAYKKHNYKTVIIKTANFSRDGSYNNKCTECGQTEAYNPITIYSIGNVKLSKTDYTYDGKEKKPKIKVTDSYGNTIPSKYYTVKYAKGRKNVGKYKVTVKFKDKYSGSKSLYFTIKPKATSISSVKASSKGFTVKWKKLTSQTTGYEIQYSTSSDFSGGKKTVTISKNSVSSKKISKLKSNRKYYVHIRTYKTIKVNGKATRIYSAWSKAKAVTTKK